MPIVKIIANENECKVKLVNGDIVVYKNLVYMVTSYGKYKEEEIENESVYCRLMDLSTGNKACVEPVSRNTTLLRIFSHLKERLKRYQNCTEPDIKHLKVIKSEEYSIEIKI